MVTGKRLEVCLEGIERFNNTYILYALNEAHDQIIMKYKYRTTIHTDGDKKHGKTCCQSKHLP